VAECGDTDATTVHTSGIRNMIASPPAKTWYEVRPNNCFIALHVGPAAQESELGDVDHQQNDQDHHRKRGGVLSDAPLSATDTTITTVNRTDRLARSSPHGHAEAPIRSRTQPNVPRTTARVRPVVRAVFASRTSRWPGVGRNAAVEKGGALHVQEFSRVPVATAGQEVDQRDCR
jgi:hypothetical protein